MHNNGCGGMGIETVRRSMGGGKIIISDGGKKEKIDRLVRQIEKGFLRWCDVVMDVEFANVR